MTQENNRIPTAIMDNGKWGSSTFAIFDGEDIESLIPGEWAQERLSDEKAAYDGDGTFDRTVDDMISDMQDEFDGDCETIVRWFAKWGLAITQTSTRHDGLRHDFYRVTESGMAKWLGTKYNC